MEIINPAKKLHLLLGQIVEEYNTYSENFQLTAEVTPIKVISRVFDIDPAETSQITEAYMSLYQLIHDVKDKAKSVTNDECSVVCKCLDEITIWLSKIPLNNDKNGLKEFINAYNVAEFSKLEMIAAFLNMDQSIEEITEEQIQQCLCSINEFKISILNDVVSPELRQLILFHINKITESIVNYKLYGTNGIRSAIERSVGACVLNQENYTKESEKSLIQKFFEVLSKINTTCSCIKNVHQIAKPMVKELIKNTTETL